MLCTPWLLPLFLHCRASLLGRDLDRRRTRTILLLRTLQSRLFLSPPLCRCRRFLRPLLLQVLADYRVTRLITIILLA